MKVPLSKTFFDDNVKIICGKILESGILVNGDYIKRFEKNWSTFCGQKTSIAVNSGTFAILAALNSLELKKGDEVLIPSHTFVASALPLLFLGLKPKFVDIDKDSYCIDPNLIENCISDKTKVIMPVDLYGCTADMEKIQKIAKKNQLFILEDACQAHGASFKGKSIGYYSDVAVYSFYPSKNLSVLGEGGMITTNNDFIAEKCKSFRDYGRINSDDCFQMGLNGLLSEIPSALGNYQIPFLNGWNQKRRELAKIYYDRLMEYPGESIIKLPKQYSNRENVYHLFVIRVKERDNLVDFLLNKGIYARIHYKVPIHKQTLFKAYRDVNLPITEKVCDTILSLPMSQFLSTDEINYVIDCIQEFYKHN